jgi:DNA-binding LacI/PurR family transcriptional regulator
METRIAVAAQGFDQDFQGHVYAELRRALQPGQGLLECAIVRWDDVNEARARLLALLAGHPRPAALIGLCLRPDAATLAGFAAASVPVILVDERADGASTVASDNIGGGYLAGQRLVRQGRRAIALVSGPIRDYNAMQRLRGVARALSEGNVPLPPENILEAPAYSYEDGTTAMGKLLGGGRALDAVICTAGDACAAGLLAAARARGVRVPEALAVVGYDDAPLAATTAPPLTTVSQSVEALAREALRLATEEASAILARPRTVLLEPRLVVRASA